MPQWKQIHKELLTCVFTTSWDNVWLSGGYISSFTSKIPTETFDSVPTNINKYLDFQHI
jgi:hypothetical protein